MLCYLSSACRRLWVLPVRRKVSVHLWKSVREKNSNEPLAFFLSQNYTEEQNSQRRTETLSQPKTQSVTAKDGYWVFNIGCWWLAIGVSRWSRPSLRGRGRGRGQFFSACSPCSQKGFCSSVKICKRENFQRASCVLFSQNYTEEQNTQRRTETLSQPIAQSITAKYGFNIMWYIQVNSVLSVVSLNT